MLFDPKWEEKNRLLLPKREILRPKNIIFVRRKRLVPATITWASSAVDTGDRTVYDQAAFQGLSISSAPAAGETRHVVVHAFGADAAGGTISCTGLTIGGSAATSVVAINASTRSASIWIRELNTGTTANIFPTFSEAIECAALIVWALYNLSSATAVNTQVNTGVGTDAFPALTNSANGVAVWGYGGQTNLSTWTWSGGPTERADQTVESPVSHTGADSTTSGTSITATATPSDGGTLGTGACASFR